MEKQIKLGYEIGTGEIITVQPSHLVATGITQLSGKTTTLEAIIKRGLFKAVVFRTKVGETGFAQGTVIPPYFKERSDWQYVSSLLEAALKEKLKFERAWIIKVCKNTDSLLEVKRNIDEQLANPSVKGLSRNIYTTLQAYFELVLPQLQYANFSRTLTINDGINIMDLERFREEIQSLVIRSVLETVLNEFRNVVIVMPEAWKFLPQGRGNPCKHTAEAFIRQGATNGNFLWIDSQDLAGVDKTPLKQVSTWILGLQQERNEVKHTLDQIPLPKNQKPTEEEIMTLNVGHFILATPYTTKKVYVQPSWLDDSTAKKIALSELDVKIIEKPEALTSTQTQIPEPKLIEFDASIFYAKVSKDIAEIRNDFFNKIQQLQKQIDAIGKTVMDLKVFKPKIDTTEITSLVLQKMPTTNKQEIIEEVLRSLPKTASTVSYEVAPLEKLQKDFLEDAKTKIMQDIRSLDDEQQKMLKFIEALGKGTTVTEILDKCLYLSKTSGGTRQRINEKLNIMASLELIRKDHGGHIFTNLKPKISKYLEIYNGDQGEVEAVYNHILMEMLS